MMKTPFRLFVALLALVLCAAPAHAVLTIEITKGVDAALPIAVVPFAWEGAGVSPLDIAAIVNADLHRSGQFAPLAEKDMLSRPSEGREINFQDWRMLGIPNLVVGKLLATAPSQYLVQFELYDVYKAKLLDGRKVPVTIKAGPDRDALRPIAHHISDIIYEKLTGVRGAFNTRIAYVTRSTKRGEKLPYTLEIADADGENAQTALKSNNSIVSITWSPDAKRIAYSSFEKNNWGIWVHDIVRGMRDRITSFDRLNSAPAWSPDGKRLAMVLSKDGNPEIYVYTLATKKLQRITRHWSVDTEPAWAPDGNSIVFNSERGGKAQIYRYYFNDGRIERLTYDGVANMNPAFSADGRLVACINRNSEGVDRVAVLELETGIMRIITDTALDESPSFAPNGSMIIYATNVNNRGVLAAVSVDGRVQQRFSVKGEGDVYAPRWSPFLQ